MSNKSIGSFLSELRKEKGITQRDLADYLGVSDKTISHWECDKYSPDISVIPILAEYFGVTCDEILRGEKKAPEHSEIDFSYEALDKESEFEKYAKIRLQNAYNKLKVSNIVSVFISAFVLAFLVIIVFIIDYHIPFELGILVSAGFSACLGILISYLAHNKFISVLNFCNPTPVEYKKWKRKANRACVLPIIYAMLVFIYIVLMLMPNRHIQVETATDTLPYHEENLLHSVEPTANFEDGDPSVPITGEIIVSSN